MTTHMIQTGGIKTAIRTFQTNNMIPIVRMTPIEVSMTQTGDSMIQVALNMTRIRGIISLRTGIQM